MTVLRSGLPLSRRHVATLVGATAALTTVSALAEYADWYGSYGETGRALEDATILTMPLAGAVAAWVAGAGHRQRFLWLIDSSPRDRFALYLRAVVMMAASAALGATLVGAVLILATAREATFGHPPFLSLVVIAGGFMAATALGVAAAAWLPTYVAPLAPVIILYGFTILSNRSGAGSYPLLGLAISDSRERTYRSTEAWVMAVRAAWWCAVALLLVALAARLASRWLLPFAASCLLATPLLLVGDAAMTVDASALKPMCSDEGDGVAICLTAARAHATSELWSDLEPVEQELHGLFPDGLSIVEETIAPAQVRQLALRGAIVQIGVANGLNGDAHVPDRSQVQSNFVASVLLANCAAASPPAENRRPAANVNDVIADWVLRQSGVATDGSAYIGAPAISDAILDYAPVQAFKTDWEHATASTRQSYLTANASAIASCSDTELPAQL